MSVKKKLLKLILDVRYKGSPNKSNNSNNDNNNNNDEDGDKNNYSNNNEEKKNKNACTKCTFKKVNRAKPFQDRLSKRKRCAGHNVLNSLRRRRLEVIR